MNCFPGVVLYPNTRLGNRCTLHAGCVLGAIGIGIAQSAASICPLPSWCWVELDDDVELGAAVTIDRGTYGAPRALAKYQDRQSSHDWSQLSNRRHNLICHMWVIAGSSSTGDYVVLAGQSVSRITSASVTSRRGSSIRRDARLRRGGSILRITCDTCQKTHAVSGSSPRD